MVTVERKQQKCNGGDDYEEKTIQMFCGGGGKTIDIWCWLSKNNRNVVAVELEKKSRNVVAVELEGKQ